jgi:hypothetical protein
MKRISEGTDMWDHNLGPIEEETGLTCPRPLEDTDYLAQEKRAFDELIAVAARKM